MLPVRIIPCLDVRDGRVVKGVRFRGLTDQGDPAALARAYEEQGADEVVVLDVTATPEGRGTRRDTVAAVRAQLSVPLTIGGGIGGVADAAGLLEAGADKVALNTAALRHPELLAELAARFGSQCVVVSIDALRTGDGTRDVDRGGERAAQWGDGRLPVGTRTDIDDVARAVQWRDGSPPDGGRAPQNRYQVVVRSGTERLARDAVAWAREAVGRGAGEILLTSIDRDGTRSGYELPLLRAVRRAVQVPIIASGGADSPAHMSEALRAGADAVLAASIFHQGNWTVGDVKEALAALGAPVRPDHTNEDGGTTIRETTEAPAHPAIASPAALWASAPEPDQAP